MKNNLSAGFLGFFKDHFRALLGLISLSILIIYIHIVKWIRYFLISETSSEYNISCLPF